MRFSGTVALSLVAVTALLARPARAAEPDGAGAPAPSPAAVAQPAGEPDAGPPSGSGAQPEERPRPPGDDDRLVPGELPPPRAIAVPAARPKPPSPLRRRTALTGNVAGFVRTPAGDHAGTWRAELALERQRGEEPTASVTGIVSAGRLRTDGRDDGWLAGVSGQYRWYFLGRFDRGAYVAGTLGFWAIDPYLAWALGGGVGLKHTGPAGLTLDLQAGLQVPMQRFRHDSGGDPPRFHDAWRTLLPGVLLNAGWSFEEGRRRR